MQLTKYFKNSGDAFITELINERKYALTLFNLQKDIYAYIADLANQNIKKHDNIANSKLIFNH